MALKLLLNAVYSNLIQQQVASRVTRMHLFLFIFVVIIYNHKKFRKSPQIISPNISITSMMNAPWPI